MVIEGIPSKLFVYPVNRASVQGRHAYQFELEDGTTRPAGRTFARDATKSYSFPSSADNTTLDTGLEKMVTNPFLNSENEQYIGSHWLDQKDDLTDESKNPELSIQTILEVIDNVPKGEYTSRRSAVKAFDTSKDRKSTFLERFRVQLKDGTNVFTADTKDGRLSILLLKRNNAVAPSKEESNDSLHDFYIGSEHEGLQERKRKRDIIGDAIRNLKDVFDKYNDFTVYQLASVLKVVKGNTMSPVITKDKLEDYVWREGKDQLDRAKKTTTYAKKLLSGKEGVEQIYTEYLVQKAIDNRVLLLDGGRFIWPSKKGIDNLYNLGRNKNTILNMFQDHYRTYDPDLEGENLYGDLISELKEKGVQLID